MKNKKLIILFPGAFKPFHDGHLLLLKSYAELEPSEIRIIISQKERSGITAKSSLDFIDKIKDKFSEDFNLELTASIAEVPSPLNVCTWIIDHSPDNEVFMVAESDKDDTKKEKDKRSNYFLDVFSEDGKYYKGIDKVVDYDVNKNALYYENRNDEFDNLPISSSIVRYDINKNNFDNFKKSYQDLLEYVSEEDLQEYFDILKADIEFDKSDMNKIKKLKNIKEAHNFTSNKYLIENIGASNMSNNNTNIIKINISNIERKYNKDIASKIAAEIAEESEQAYTSVAIEDNSKCNVRKGDMIICAVNIDADLLGSILTKYEIIEDVPYEIVLENMNMKTKNNRFSALNERFDVDECGECNNLPFDEEDELQEFDEFEDGIDTDDFEDFDDYDMDLTDEEKFERSRMYRNNPRYFSDEAYNDFMNDRQRDYDVDDFEEDYPDYDDVDVDDFEDDDYLMESVEEDKIRNRQLDAFAKKFARLREKISKAPSAKYAELKAEYDTLKTEFKEARLNRSTGANFAKNLAKMGKCLDRMEQIDELLKENKRFNKTSKMVNLSEALKARDMKHQSKIDKSEEVINDIVADIKAKSKDELTPDEVKKAIAKLNKQKDTLSKYGDDKAKLDKMSGVKAAINKLAKCDPTAAKLLENKDIRNLSELMLLRKRERKMHLHENVNINGKSMMEYSLKDLNKMAEILENKIAKNRKTLLNESTNSGKARILSEKYSNLLERINEEIMYRNTYMKKFGLIVEEESTQKDSKTDNNTATSDNSNFDTFADMELEDAPENEATEKEDENSVDENEEVELTGVVFTMKNKDAADDFINTCKDAGVPEEALEIVEDEEEETKEESEEDSEEKNESVHSRISKRFRRLLEGEGDEEDSEEGEDTDSKETSEESDGDETSTDDEQEEKPVKVRLVDTDYTKKVAEVLDDVYGMSKEEFEEKLGGEIVDNNDEETEEKDDDKDSANEISAEDLFKDL